MPLRLLQVSLPTGADPQVDQLLEGRSVVATWTDPSEHTSRVIQVLIPAEEAEPVMDKLEQWFGGRSGFRVVLYPLTAAIPREEEIAKPDQEGASNGGVGALKASGRVSREELYSSVNDSLGVNRVFVAMTALSSVVAAVGLLDNDVAVIIGAMVIAPLLGPNVAMALATTLGDLPLLRRSLLTNIAGVLLGLLIAVGVGALHGVDPGIPAIESRTHVEIADVVLALAAGSAGAFAVTRGQSGALIGVMVAVALMPPLVVFGMLAGAAQWKPACGALLLLLANVVCVNLSGVATFLTQGVWPRTWWEGERAKRSTLRAIMIWITLLAVLVALLYVST